jgi:hypothetical protein
MFKRMEECREQAPPLRPWPARTFMQGGQPWMIARFRERVEASCQRLQADYVELGGWQVRHGGYLDANDKAFPGYVARLPGRKLTSSIASPTI